MTRTNDRYKDEWFPDPACSERKQFFQPNKSATQLLIPATQLARNSRGCAATADGLLQSLAYSSVWDPML